MKKGSNRAKTIKLHELELRKHRMKVKDQEKEMRILSKENFQLRGSLEALNTVHIATMISIAEKYGAAVGDGVKELVVPRVNVDELTKKYSVEYSIDSDTKEATIRIKNI